MEAVLMAESKNLRPTRQEEDSAIARSIDWTHYDRLKAQGLADREIARQWGIPWGTFHREKQKHVGHAGLETSGVPAWVPQQPSIEAQKGTPPGTPSSMEVDELAEAVASRIFPMMQGWLRTEVPQRVPAQVPDEIPEEVSEWVPILQSPLVFLGYPKGTPAYPDHPEKDSRLNLHLPEGERWEFRAVAKGLDLEPSLLFRRLWRGYMQTPQAKAALQRYLAAQGTSEGTPQGS
jgi:hypothetical protein